MLIHILLDFVHRVSGRWFTSLSPASGIIGRCYFDAEASPMVAFTMPSSRSGNGTPEVSDIVSYEGFSVRALPEQHQSNRFHRSLS